MRIFGATTTGMPASAHRAIDVEGDFYQLSATPHDNHHPTALRAILHIDFRILPARVISRVIGYCRQTIIYDARDSARLLVATR